MRDRGPLAGWDTGHGRERAAPSWVCVRFEHTAHGGAALGVCWRTWESPEAGPLAVEGHGLHAPCFDPVAAGGSPEALGSSFTLAYPVTSVVSSSLKGLNPGKAIAEIKKMMATYTGKKASV